MKKKKLVLFPCNLIQFYSSCKYSASDEYNCRHVVLTISSEYKYTFLRAAPLQKISSSDLATSEYCSANWKSNRREVDRMPVLFHFARRVSNFSRACHPAAAFFRVSTPIIDYLRKHKFPA